MLTCLVHVLFTFHTQGVLKLKKNNSGAKRLIFFEVSYKYSILYCIMLYYIIIKVDCYLLLYHFVDCNI